MSRQAPFALRPTRADLAVAKASARIASPPLEQSIKAATWLADEKFVLAGTVLFWLWQRTRPTSEDSLRTVDHMLVCVAVAGLLPDLFKLLVRRRRPDRSVVRGRRPGIPPSGN